MPSFTKVVVDALSVMNELRVWEQAPCWVVPKHKDTILLWSLVHFNFENIWVLGQVVANTVVWYFVQSLSKQGIHCGVRS